MLKTYAVEDENAPKALDILKKEGFEEIKRMPRLCLYDYEAQRKGKKAYVEVRCRSDDKAPYYVFRRSKLARLRELKEETGSEVYILLMWRSHYRLCELDRFPPEDLKPMNVQLFGTSVGALRFPLKWELTDEEVRKAIELREEGFTQKQVAEKLGRSEAAVRKHLPGYLRKLGTPKGTKITRARVTICLEDHILREVDGKRGLVSRSAYINDALEQALGLKHDKALA